MGGNMGTGEKEPKACVMKRANWFTQVNLSSNLNDVKRNTYLIL